MVTLSLAMRSPWTGRERGWRKSAEIRGAWKAPEGRREAPNHTILIDVPVKDAKSLLPLRGEGIVVVQSGLLTRPTQSTNRIQSEKFSALLSRRRWPGVRGAPP